MSELTTLTLTDDMLESVQWGEDDPSTGIKIIEQGEWEQDCKIQFRNTIFEYDGKFWSYNESRSGSYHSDWEYDESYPAVRVVPIIESRTVYHPYK